MCFWDNNDFSMIKKSLSYEIQYNELEYDIELIRIKNIEIVELV